MAYAAKPIARTDAAWVAPGDTPELVGSLRVTQAWLAGLGDDELADHGLVRAAISGVPPVAGLGEPPEVVEIDGALAWQWSPGGLANFRSARMAEVALEASRRASAIMSLDAKLNALATGLEMTMTYGPDPANWPIEAWLSYQAVMPAWTAIKAIRVAEAEIKAALPNDAAGLAAFDVQAAEWPAA